MKRKLFSITAMSFIFVAGLLISILFSNETIYKAKCSRCHNLKVPENYTVQEWEKNVKRMAKRAGLTEQEIKEITSLKRQD